MKRDRLMLVEDCGLYRLQWYIAEDDDMGGTLGEGPTFTVAEMQTRLANPTTTLEECEILAAVIAASKCNPDERSHRGFSWESRRAATAALQAVRLAIKSARATRPLPDWAVTAAAAGWKPPKGWAP